MLFALLMERLVRLLDLVATKNTSFDVVVRMMVNLIPHYLSLALATAFFIAVLMATIRLREDSELDALYAGGISLYQVIRPILGLAVVLGVVGALVIGVLQPQARYAYRNLFHLAGYGSWYNVLESGAFLTGIDDMTMTVGSIADNGRELTAVFFHERDDTGGMTTTTAERGRFDISADEKLVLTLENATQVINGMPDQEPLVVQVKRFSREIDTLFTPPPFRPRGKDERELTLVELWQRQNDPPRKVTTAEMAAELHARSVRIMSILVLPFLAVALGATSPRRRQGGSLALGLFLLIVYNEILQLGESMIQDGKISPWIGQQLPLLLFTLVSLWAFVKAAGHISGSPWDPLARQIGRMVDAVRGIWQKRDA